jgi:gas vesicle protein
VAENDDKLEDMDEELARARKDADKIDVYKYRRRFRLLKAILLGAALAGLTSLILAMIDGQKNPCERVRNHLCKQDPAGLQCKSYASIVDDSVHDSSAEMRSNIRAQCQTKIERLKEEGVEVK